MANILDFFKDLFSNSDSSMSYDSLYKKIMYWKDNKVYPHYYDLPTRLSFPDSFWKKVEQLHQLTINDGHERSISVFWVDGDWVVSSTIRGTESSVVSGGYVSAKYVPTSRREYFNKEIYIDNQLYSKREVYYKNMPQKIILSYLFNLHTHPRHQYLDQATGLNKDYYGFFSIVDVNSLINTNTAMAGMINDKLWILIQTMETPKVLNNFEEKEISEKSLEERLKFGVYSGSFGMPLTRKYHISKLNEINDSD